MPIYEYRCQSCGHELEKLQRLSDANLTDCPECGDAELQRLISAAGFRLKGAGWYETDFKQGNKRNLAESSNTGSGSAPASSSADSNGGGAAKAGSPASESGKSNSSKPDSSASTSSTNNNKSTSTKSVSPA